MHSCLRDGRQTRRWIRGEIKGGGGGGFKGVRETSDSQASSKGFDSATGSPLTQSGDNMWLFIILLQKNSQSAKRLSVKQALNVLR